MAPLPPCFYDRDTVQVARDLVGKLIVRTYQGQRLVCRITETEAYVGRCDKACHAYGYKRTPRTQTLFAPPGTCYLYLIYGMYHCLNFVTEPEGEPAAVLIRGARPLLGLETMARLRYETGLDLLTPAQRRHFLDGPGKLCQALALTRGENGLDLTREGPLWVTDDPECLGLPPLPPVPSIGQGKRIGIAYAQEAVDFPWRFFDSTEATP